MAKRSLEQRERKLIVAAATVFMLIVILFFARPFAREYERTQLQVRAAVQHLDAIRDMRELVLEERSAQHIITDRIEARAANFDLYTFTNNKVKQLRLPPNSSSLQSHESRFAGGALDVVQINLTNVSMKQLVDFLFQMHSSGNLIALQRLGFLRPMRDGKGLECEIVLMAPKA